MMRAYPFPTLPDYLRSELDLVFIGINPGLYSVQKGHYFARKSSRFWPAFSASKLSKHIRRDLRTEVLQPQHDSELIRFGVGFTDVIKRPSANAGQLDPQKFAEWVPVLLRKLHRYAPRVACFHGLTGFRPFLEIALLSDRQPILGPQPETIGKTRLYVVPNPSPANAHFTLAEQTSWYDRLAEFVSAA